MTKNELVKLADETMRLGKTLLENARIKQAVKQRTQRKHKNRQVSAK